MNNRIVPGLSVMALVCVLLPAAAQAQFAQQAKLVGAGALGIAGQGYSVSLSADGKTAIVGGPGDNSDLASDDYHIGAAWVYTYSGGVWTQQGPKLVSTDSRYAAQGVSVSLSSDGNTAIVGGPGDNFDVGAAWIYTRSGAVWSQQAKLVGTDASLARQGFLYRYPAMGTPPLWAGLMILGKIIDMPVPRGSSRNQAECGASKRN